ncbi:hypothetical protein SCLCIDRAFT_1211212 [Scleroderma citrinum Foug A]|uniref:Uncharacterized protein n=1 Tax=Scleroderma citrinum Foug A TaxID=1036808 RepID=A0A0C3EEX2_9AGAM|nr:hypothetical protein SCLCIDRAFT_1211212 [Scleroderma citrinum Foug A]
MRTLDPPGKVMSPPLPRPVIPSVKGGQTYVSRYERRWLHLLKASEGLLQKTNEANTLNTSILVSKNDELTTHQFKYVH